MNSSNVLQMGRISTPSFRLQVQAEQEKRRRKAARIEQAQQTLDCVPWSTEHFYIEDRYHLTTAEPLGVGAILLADHQKHILNAALERDGSGRFRWSTIIWSAPKKSGKTRIAAMVAAWLARYSGQYAEVYCLANDGKQSADRVLAAIKKAVTLSPSLKTWRTTLTSITLPNGAFIEAVPVDPTGEAGGQPTGSFWSELWGFKHSAAKKLWTEFTIPPTRFGYAIRWVESYAGYTGESPVLENLYDAGINSGARDTERFPDLPVYLNEAARIFAYWDETPRMAWQTPEYYEQEAATLTESEFLRVHRNQWVSSEASAIPIDLWDARHDRTLKQLSNTEPVVLGLDLSVSGDYCALVAVTKHPKGVAIRAARVWKPPQGGKIDYSLTVEPELRRWCEVLNVVCVAYDEYQAHKMTTDLGSGDVVEVECMKISRLIESLEKAQRNHGDIDVTFWCPEMERNLPVDVVEFEDADARAARPEPIIVLGE